MPRTQLLASPFAMLSPGSGSRPDRRHCTRSPTTETGRRVAAISISIAATWASARPRRARCSTLRVRSPPKILEITGGADLAEPFEMTEGTLPVGSVVVIDAVNPGQLELTSRAYDSRVAGIISGAGGVRPGLTLNQQGTFDGGQNVALTGRVYAKASAANGPIQPGDLLTTSDLPGHAMKATDARSHAGRRSRQGDVVARERDRSRARAGDAAMIRSPSLGALADDRDSRSFAGTVHAQPAPFPRHTEPYALDTGTPRRPGGGAARAHRVSADREDPGRGVACGSTSATTLSAQNSWVTFTSLDDGAVQRMDGSQSRGLQRTRRPTSTATPSRSNCTWRQKPRACLPADRPDHGGRVRRWGSDRPQSLRCSDDRDCLHRSVARAGWCRPAAPAGSFPTTPTSWPATA